MMTVNDKAAISYRPQTEIYPDVERGRIFITQDREHLREDEVTIWFDVNDIPTVIAHLQQEMAHINNARRESPGTVAGPVKEEGE